MKTWIRILSVTALVLGVTSGAWAKGDDGGKSEKSKKNPCIGALLHGSQGADFPPFGTRHHATIYADSGIPSAVIRLMTLTAISASLF